MTNNQEKLNTLKILGILLVVVASVLAVIAAAVSPQNAMATICPPMCDEDIDIEEAEEAGNATMVGRDMNQTTNPEMPGTNSTS